MRVSCEISSVVQPRRPHRPSRPRLRRNNYPASDGAVVMSVNGDWHESPAQLQALIFCRLQQARPGDT